VTLSDLELRCINTIRFLSADAIQKAKSGHPGLPMGAAPMAHALWSRHLRFDPKATCWPDRDRFVLSAGHGSMLLYSMLHLTGYDIPIEEIESFRQWGSHAPGHPENILTPGVEATTGPLGQGIANAVGMAIAEAHLAAEFNTPDFPNIVHHHTYSICGDGDLMEGISYEAASLAGHLKLGKLIVLFDDNRISLAGASALSTSEDIEKRFEAAEWQVIRVGDGNDVDSIDDAISRAKACADKPSLIMVRTVIGFGSPNKAGSSKAHGSPLGEAELRETKKSLGWPLEPAFYLPEDVIKFYRDCGKQAAEAHRTWLSDFENYRQTYPDEAAEFERRFAERLPDNWNSSLPKYSATDDPIATRKAGEAAMKAMADKLPELIGGCADLNPSTFAWLPGHGDFQPDETVPAEQIEGSVGGVWGYAGRNIHFGVREHAMGSVALGIALHGGLIPFTGTFFVFLDYMRPSIRLAALSRIRTIFVFSHDSIGVGEDGPTHQPVEHIANLRAIPDLVTIRPADGNEAVEAWRIAIERKDGPTALVFSRQKLPIIDREKTAAASDLRRGAYIIRQANKSRTDIILIATGSEVSIAIEAAKMLEKEGIAVRVLSMPSWELFEAQPVEYRESILPPNIKARIAIEAGIGQGWERYIGFDGDFIGMSGFGASAPAKILYEKFGITAKNIVERAKILISK